MALTAAERTRCRYHLGYLNASFAGSASWGLPRPIQTIFILEDAMGLVIEDAIGIVRDLIARLDETENQIFDAQIRLAAERLGSLTLRADEIERLQSAYVMWANRLADTLGVPLYAYSSKFKSIGMGGAGNIPRS